MTSATDELRLLLDERGMEYDESTQGNTTLFRFDYCDRCDDYLHTIAITGACISAYSDYLTPEQAIAATLGGGTLTAEQVQKVIYKHGINDGFVYSVLRGSFQAIADELNATLGSGTCENIAQYPLVNFECSECGCTVEGGDELGADIQHGEWNHCPNCGKAVKR